MTQGERIRELRKTLKMTMEQFGEKIGVTKSTISNIENGNRNATEHMVKSICREFIERIDRIMVGEDDARKNLFKALLEASDEDIAAFQRIIDLFASKKD